MNTDWEKLSPLQLGQFGEYYAKMKFASYGYDVYTSEVDDHGVDFILISENIAASKRQRRRWNESVLE